jgi:hypothetical protein
MYEYLSPASHPVWAAYPDNSASPSIANSPAYRGIVSLSILIQSVTGRNAVARPRDRKPHLVRKIFSKARRREAPGRGIHARPHLAHPQRGRSTLAIVFAFLMETVRRNFEEYAGRNAFI